MSRGPRGSVKCLIRSSEARRKTGSADLLSHRRCPVTRSSMSRVLFARTERSPCRHRTGAGSPTLTYGGGLLQADLPGVLQRLADGLTTGRIDPIA